MMAKSEIKLNMVRSDAYITLRFIERFLEYWGLVTLKPSSGSPMDAQGKARKVDIQPLLRESFKFLV